MNAISLIQKHRLLFGKYCYSKKRVLKRIVFDKFFKGLGSVGDEANSLKQHHTKILSYIDEHREQLLQYDPACW